jgi:2-keto-3-deoxy-galactonokinase
VTAVRIDWDTDSIRMEAWQSGVALVIRTKHGSGFVSIPFEDANHALEFFAHRAAELAALSAGADR